MAHGIWRTRPIVLIDNICHSLSAICHLKIIHRFFKPLAGFERALEIEKDLFLLFLVLAGRLHHFLDPIFLNLREGFVSPPEEPGPAPEPFPGQRDWEPPGPVSGWRLFYHVQYEALSGFFVYLVYLVHLVRLVLSYYAICYSPSATYKCKRPEDISGRCSNFRKKRNL
jgi:hypothetical protein